MMKKMATNNFKRQLQIDNTTVFYNEHEFAITITWNGYPLLVVDETPTESTLYTHGIESETVIYRCDIRSLNPHPTVRERVNINGDYWNVISVQKLTSDLVIRLERLTS